MSKPFKEQAFYHCHYDRWGYRGVPGYGLTFEQACEIIKVASGEDTVKRFEEEEDCYFEFRRGQFMVSEECFIARIGKEK